MDWVKKKSKWSENELHRDNYTWDLHFSQFHFNVSPEWDHLRYSLYLMGDEDYHEPLLLGYSSTVESGKEKVERIIMNMYAGLHKHIVSKYGEIKWEADPPIADGAEIE
jgi:hypothetical protein